MGITLNNIAEHMRPSHFDVLRVLAERCEWSKEWVSADKMDDYVSEKRHGLKPRYDLKFLEETLQWFVMHRLAIRGHTGYRTSAEGYRLVTSILMNNDNHLSNYRNWWYVMHSVTTATEAA